MSASRTLSGFILLPVVMALLLIAMLAFALDRQSAIGVEATIDDAAMEAARTAAEAGMAEAIVAGGNMSCPAAGTSGTQIGTVGAGSYTTTWKFATASTLVLTSTGTSGSGTRTLTRTVDAYAATPYVLTVVRPDPNTPSVVYDTLIAANGTSYNFGGDSRLIVANGSGSTVNTLLRFDLAAAGLPAKAKVTGAVLTLSRSSVTLNVSTTATVVARKITTAWDEGSGAGLALLGTLWSSSTNGASWKYSSTSPTTAWSAASGGQTAVGIGDVDLPVDAQSYTFSTFTSGTPPQITLDVTPAAAEWVADPTKNYGVLIASNDSLAAVPFSSSETSTAAYRPTLAITYLMPCGMGAPPSVSAAFADASVSAGSTSVLTVTLSNPNPSNATGTALSFSLPTGMSLVGSPLTSCGGTAGSSTSGSTTTLTLTGARIPTAGGAAGTCTLTATVSPTAVGTYSLAIPAGALTSSFGASTAAAGASISATNGAPGVSKTIAPGTDPWAAPRVVLTLSNPNSFSLSISSTFTDNLPAGMVGSTAPTSTCGGTVKLISSGQGIQQSGGSIPAAGGGVPGTCTITAPVQIAPVGAYTNTVAAGALKSPLGNNASPASAAVLPSAADTEINGLYPLNNYGTAPSMPIQEYSVYGVPGRWLIRFDASSVPAGTTLTSARLRIYTTTATPSGKTVTLAAYALPQAFVEGTGGPSGVPLAGADWTASDPAGGKNWPVAGAVNLASATPVGSGTVPAGAGWVDFDVTTQAQNWITSGKNYGLLIVNPNLVTGQDVVTVYGRKSGTPPQLMVSY